MKRKPLLFMAVLMPPLAVAIKKGLHKNLWINFILTLIGWIPGVIHALIVVAGRNKQPAV